MNNIIRWFKILGVLTITAAITAVVSWTVLAGYAILLELTGKWFTAVSVCVFVYVFIVMFKEVKDDYPPE